MAKTIANIGFEHGCGAQCSNIAVFNPFGYLKRFIAFTLAETLIVIGIIGVVASLTIPNLNSTTADKEKVAKVKKVHAQLSEAINRVIAVYGPLEDWSEEQQKNFPSRLKEFLKISKSCEQDDTSCFSGPDYSNTGNYAQFVTADGTAISVSSLDEYVTSYFDIDIDGPNKGKNKFGYDKFAFYYTAGESSCTGEYKNNLRGHDNCVSTIAPPCTGELSSGCYFMNENSGKWVIEMGNMDYLKVDDKGKCNDSDIVLDWTTNTSCK